MGMNLTKKIISSHLAKPSEMKPGDDIFVKVDQTLTHDINANFCGIDNFGGAAHNSMG